jgi:hypothetical protein
MIISPCLHCGICNSELSLKALESGEPFKKLKRSTCGAYRSYRNAKRLEDEEQANISYIKFMEQGIRPDIALEMVKEIYLGYEVVWSV